MTKREAYQLEKTPTHKKIATLNDWKPRKLKAVKIPYDQLSPEALQGVVEEFVTRDGTDYGEVEILLVETKMCPGDGPD